MDNNFLNKTTKISATSTFSSPEFCDADTHDDISVDWSTAGCSSF